MSTKTNLKSIHLQIRNYIENDKESTCLYLIKIIGIICKKKHSSCIHTMKNGWSFSYLWECFMNSCKNNLFSFSPFFLVSFGHNNSNTFNDLSYFSDFPSLKIDKDEEQKKTKEKKKKKKQFTSQGI
ncbi:hypothetical protein M0811_14519 [Anaeramoeba ignava]|uniref:Uncharacterized protein n=1 Tax=Anaeramoeba ignava TaxID=1746090 RepID=A0A9Q0LV19_ANAIG|nr:hypothetical protein M0811_14519 [Anaeramoeba ignava]